MKVNLNEVFLLLGQSNKTQRMKNSDVEID